MNKKISILKSKDYSIKNNCRNDVTESSVTDSYWDFFHPI